MTKSEAQKRLAATWRFNRVGGNIVLREVALIEAVRADQASSAVPPSAPLFTEAHRPS